MTDTIILVVFCVVILAAIILCIALAYWWHGAVSDSQAAAGALHTAETNLLEAERQRDDEHAARVGAETTVKDLTAQVAATQAALNGISKEDLNVIGLHIRNGDAGSAVDFIRSVFARPVVSSSTNTNSGHDGAAKTAVPASGATGGSDVAHVDPR